METRDWSLVVFTLLSQAAVGAFLTLLVLRRLAGRRGAATGGGASDGALFVPLLAVLIVLSAGLFAALFHLSTPLQAARAVVNFSSSWLSREIVFGSLFAALLGALVALERQARGNPRASRWLAPLAALAGVTFLYCQTAIYLLPAQPAWNSFATPAAFGGTALRLGILGVAAGAVAWGLPPAADPAARRGATSWTTVRGLALAGLVVLATELVVLPLHLAALAADGSPAAAASAQRLTGDYGGILLLRLTLLGVAGAALAGVARGSAPSPRRPPTAALTYLSFSTVLLSELCGRFLFYAMQVRVGI